MKQPAQEIRDASGSAAVEFGLTAPLFFMLLFGIIAGGMLLWVQLGLQHGTEMAARCASVNKLICDSPQAVKDYAAQQTFGFTPPSSSFTVSIEPCGNQVSASYAFPFVTSYFGIPVLTLTTQSCFPK